VITTRRFEGVLGEVWFQHNKVHFNDCMPDANQGSTRLQKLRWLRSPVRKICA